jgi:hypothetical protein
MKTAMQIILNDLKLKYKIYEDANLYNLASALETSIDLASKLLELEKQQIKDASLVDLNLKYPMITKYSDMAEEYYNETFNK